MPSELRLRLTADRLRQLLHYAPETGLFYRRVTRGNAALGAEAGYLRRDGYITIRIDGFSYFAHRLAWLYIRGEHPVGVVDHANGKPGDNRIANLRDCSRRQSAWNREGWSTRSGFKGVSRENNKWTAIITVNRRKIRIGLYSTPQEAAAEYDKAARLHHGEFARTNAQIAADRAADASGQLRSISNDEIIQSEHDPAQRAKFGSYQHNSEPRPETARAPHPEERPKAASRRAARAVSIKRVHARR